jgi:hypothetical protein
VCDFTSDGFQVTDAGKPQTIVFFHRNDIKLRQQASGPNEFSNRSGETIPHVHDLERMESADDLYLLTVDGGFYSAHGLTPAEGEAAGPTEAHWTRRIKTLMDAGMKAVLRPRPPDIDVAWRVQLAYAALDVIAAQLSPFSGPKEYCVDYRRRAGGPWSDSLQYRRISGLHAAAPATEQGVGTVEDLNLTGAPSDAFQDGIDFPGDKKAGDQADRFRVVVFDRGSDAIGSLTIPVGAPGQSRL